MAEFTATEKLREVERELAVRKHVYPRSVIRGRLSQKHADHRVGVLEAIAADYRAQIAADGAPLLAGAGQ